MQKLTFSLGVTLLGMLVVFMGLLILILFIRGLGAITSRADRKKEESAPVKVESAPVEDAPDAQPAAEEGIPAEVIAAISAAIAVVMQGSTGFTVRHVRRLSNSPAWARAGREEQNLNRL